MTPEVVPAPSSLKGISLKIGSVVLFSMMAAMLKAVSDTIPPGEMVFFRSAFGILPIIIALAVAGELSEGLRARSPIMHIRRGVIGTASMASGFVALGYLSLPEATVLGYAAPILTVVFAAFLLGETIRLVRISAVLMGMAGVLIVLWPQLTGGGGTHSLIGSLFALGGAGLAALVAIQIRLMVGTERSSAIVFWFSATATVLSALTFPFGWVMPTPTQALLLIGAGLFGGAAQILMTSAYRYADASLIAPFEYVSILFALILGRVFFGDVPSIWTLAGSAVIVCAGVTIILRERYLGQQQNRKQRPLEH